MGRVQTYTLGYDHEFDVIQHVVCAIGGQQYGAWRRRRIETNLRLSSCGHRTFRAIAAGLGPGKEIKLWKAASLILLTIVIVAAGYGIALMRRGFSARRTSSAIEEFAATATRRLAVPTKYPQLRNVAEKYPSRNGAFCPSKCVFPSV
jgi:hypothetical protein